MKNTNIPDRSKAKYMNINVISISIFKNPTDLNQALARGSWEILDLSLKFNYIY